MKDIIRINAMIVLFSVIVDLVAIVLFYTKATDILSTGFIFLGSFVLAIVLMTIVKAIFKRKIRKQREREWWTDQRNLQ